MFDFYQNKKVSESLVDAPFYLYVKIVADLDDTVDFSGDIEVKPHQLAGTKKAPTGAFLRLLQEVKSIYFLPIAAKRLLNLSTRPPVSAAFCLPV